MLVDLLNSSNYIMVNKDAIQILGLNTAVYCSELLNIYKKAVKKKKLYNVNYFKVDREYILDQTSLSIEDQLKCDINLEKVNIIQRNETDPDMIYFDVEVFASLLSSEDVKLLDKVSAKVKVTTPKGTREAKQKYTIQSIKDSIRCNTPEVLYAMRDWIDSIFEAGKGISKPQVAIFKDKLDDYCDGDLNKALKILQIATIHNYVDCQWAINMYERDNQPRNNTYITSNAANQGKEQKVTTIVSEELF